MATSNRKTSDELSPPLGWRYIRTDEALPGVPARDLTADEVAALDPDLWANALAHGLYEEIR